MSPPEISPAGLARNLPTERRVSLAHLQYDQPGPLLRELNNGGKRATAGGAPKHLWSQLEDAKLAAAVARLGEKSWSEIASLLPGRVGKQCRDRWRNHLCPGVKKGDWHDAEDQLLFALHLKLGNQWAEIAKLVPGRTDLSVKNRFYSYLRKVKRQFARQAKEPEVGDGNAPSPSPALLQLGYDESAVSKELAYTYRMVLHDHEAAATAKAAAEAAIAAAPLAEAAADAAAAEMEASTIVCSSSSSSRSSSRASTLPVYEGDAEAEGTTPSTAQPMQRRVTVRFVGEGINVEMPHRVALSASRKVGEKGARDFILSSSGSKSRTGKRPRATVVTSKVCFPELRVALPQPQPQHDLSVLTKLLARSPLVPLGEKQLKAPPALHRPETWASAVQGLAQQAPPALHRPETWASAVQGLAQLDAAAICAARPRGLSQLPSSPRNEVWRSIPSSAIAGAQQPKHKGQGSVAAADLLLELSRSPAPSRAASPCGSSVVAKAPLVEVERFLTPVAQIKSQGAGTTSSSRVFFP